MAEPWLWIPVTLAAAFFQAIRTAGQKHLTRSMDAYAITFVRYLFGFPFAYAYLWALTGPWGRSMPAFNTEFVLSAAAGAMAQIVGTVLLVRLFTFRNFAVGTTYSKTEAFLTALVAFSLFGEAITPPAWAGIGLSVIGVVLLNLVRTAQLAGMPADRSWTHAAAVGLGSGIAFAFSGLFIRKASLALGAGFLESAAMTLVFMVTFQGLLLAAFIAFRDPGQFRAIAENWRVSFFVGVTSVTGSACWFTAMTLERVSYVKALGQVEFLFTIIITIFLFRERIHFKEYLGIFLILGGLLLVTLAG